MKFSHESAPKKGIAEKFKKAALAALLAVGVGSGAENAPKNPAEKGAKPAAEFKIENPKKQYEAIENKVVKSGADTFKTDGNMSMEQLQEEMTGEAPEEFKSDYDIEKSRVVKSGVDTYKSEGRMSVESNSSEVVRPSGQHISIESPKETPQTATDAMYDKKNK